MKEKLLSQERPNPTSNFCLLLLTSCAQTHFCCRLFTSSFIWLYKQILFCYIVHFYIITFNFHFIDCRILPSRLSTVNGSILIVMAFVANFKTIFSNCGFILSGIGIEDSSEPFIWYCIFLLESEKNKQVRRFYLIRKS